MKKLLVVLAILLCASFASAQTFVNDRGSDLSNTNLFRPVDIITVTSWSAFASDSSATTYSVPFDISKYDSMDCYVRATSTWGVPVFTATLLVGFDNTNFTSTAVGTIADTTSVKSKVLSYVGTCPTRGAKMGKIKLVPQVTGATTTDCNRTDDSINFILLAHRKQF